MKIVIATPILYDPTSPFNHLFRDMLEGFVKAGHEVVRIVAVENTADDAYKMELENIEYIPVIRKKAGHANIIQRYLTDTLTNIKMARKLKKIKADILFEDVSYSSFWSVMAAKRNNMRVVSMLQDVWPDNAVQTGIIKENSLIYKYFEFWQKKVYEKSDKLICISDDIKNFIANKGVSSNKIEVIYNWGYTDTPKAVAWKDNAFVQKYNLNPDVFYVIYAGNIGRMQNIDLIIRAAEHLQDEKQIQFLIIGDGVKKEDIIKQIQDKNLKNVLTLPMQPAEMATSIYCAANVNVIPLVKGGTKTALPSKTGVVLSCGKPVIFCFDHNSAFYDLLKKYHAGFCVSSEDEEELVKSIKEIFHNQYSNNVGSLNLYKDFFVKSQNVNRYSETVVK